ncbi:PH, RCC1 and FYVE domains-containing protein 1-like isoform X1 [Oryza glaberrima]|uniref:PH, RCC1 and FYVE domains-containing protein 1-like isoform X1 n=1 Tax=Oryza glaberrima TaxID=4538 RepID=UPI00224C214F|nr:PH, RCC1 and FYVE domains-containing protein 1-like isoform X1 [Oryza glaberrima]XP_052140479.1 PH, RCC1 and FYVE domains-containing protein 1-like isoform X1 [Oryza glaberrima]XP_052140480.1 PH, RCC1 and FYVE domains-containing protein 1-like isoform X1 [Oryza glaberrima]
MTPDETALITLKKGTKLIKYSRRGKPKIRAFRLSSVSDKPQDETSLIWFSHKKEKFLRLSSVTKIIPGQRTAVFGRFLHPEKDYLSFSLIFKNGQRSLDLVCKDQAEVEVWFSALEGLISSFRKKSLINEHKDRVSFSEEVTYYQDRHSYDSTLDITSNISRSFNSAGYCGTNSFSFRKSDVGFDRLNMIRTSAADSSRVSISSALSSYSQGSGTDDIESLGDVYVWGEVWTDVTPSDGHTSSSCSKVDVLIPKPLESDVVLDVNQIACGTRHVALTTRQGEVFTWGEEFGGRLGHGTDADISRPKLVESLSLTVVDLISCGEFHTCAVTTSGDLFNWGDGSYNVGLLGCGTEVSYWLPKKVSGPLEGLQVLSVACGSWHSALTTSSGKLYTFGDGTFGVLGHGDRETLAYPKEVEALSGFKTIKVACGIWHSAAIVEVTNQTGANVMSKKLYTWGDGDKNRLGHGDKEPRLVPKCVQALLEYNFHQLACGHNMTVALATSGRVFTMGSSSNGQLGNPKSDGKQPCLVQDRLASELVEEISCGASHVTVLTSRSEVYTWGMGANGRLGHGDLKDRKKPCLVEALKDRHVKSISCGSNFTTCICIHKWVSGADQSVCTGCRQAFGFTRKRHDCYNCGLVHCHACSSRKVLKAALAPTPGKPHRVCDSCFLKLKAAETGSNNSNRRNAVTRRSIDGREKLERPEIRPSRTTAPAESVKYTEVKAARNDMRASQISSLLQFKDLSFSALQPTAMSPAVTMSPAVPALSTPSPYTKKTKSPAPAIPQFPKTDIDNLQKSNELLNQEMLKLQSQVDSLKQKCEAQHEQLQISDKKTKTVVSMAMEEYTRCSAVVEFVKFLDNELNGIVHELPSDAAESLKALQNQVQALLREQRSHPSELLNPMDHDGIQLSSGGNALHDFSNHRSGSTRYLFMSQDASSASGSAISLTSEPPSHRGMEHHAMVPNDFVPKHDTHGEVQLIEQFEPGVYVTLIQLKDGSKVFKRVRFSKKKFAENQAEEWWRENQERVFKKYSHPTVPQTTSTKTGSSNEEEHHS